jgi:hypothetical protein
VNIAYAPRPEYGLVVPLLAHVDGGVTARGGAEWLVLTAPLDLQLERGTVYGQLTLNAGQTIHLALHRSTLEQTPAHIWSKSELAATVNASVADLQSWSDIHQTYDGPGMDQRPSVQGSFRAFSTRCLSWSRSSAAAARGRQSGLAGS